jgi:hypothetical protein
LATMTASVGEFNEPLPGRVLAKALKIAKRDRVFADVVGDVPFRVRGKGRWGQVDGPDLGVWLELHLRRPLRVDAVLPVADIPPDTPTKGECRQPYRQTWHRYRASEVTEISLLIDFRRRTVAEINTNAHVYETERAADRPYPSCRPS